MKKSLVILMAIGMFGAMPVMAAEHGSMKMDTPDGVKECLLVSESIQDKVKRLETELAKGEKNYSAKELIYLQKKLSEANNMLDQMNEPYQR